MKNIYFGIMAGLLLLSSCTENDGNLNQGNGKVKSFTTVKATIGELGNTRAFVVNEPSESDKSIGWSDEDAVFVLSNTKTQLNRYNMANIQDNVATFKGPKVSGSKFYALYPDYGWSVDEHFPNKLHFELKADAATNGNEFYFDAPMVAVSGDDFDGNFFFKQTTGMIHISIGNIYQLESVVLYGNNNEPLLGSGYVDLTEDNPSFRIDDNPEWSIDAVPGHFFNMETGSMTMDAYFTLPVMTFENGFRIEIKGQDTEGKPISITKSITSKVDVERAQVLNFKLVDVKAELRAKGEGDIIGDVEVSNTQGLTLSTLDDSQELDNGSFIVETVDRDQPQLLLVTDENDNFILLGRDNYNSNENVQVNAESSAIALVSLHPFLAPIGSKDYDNLEQLIKNTPSFSSLVFEVEQSIQDRRDLFDTENTSLLIALNNVYEELGDERTNLEALSRLYATTRAGVNVDAYPLSLETYENILSIRNTGLAPTYYGTITNASGNVLSDNFVVHTRNNYGGMDMFTRTVGNMNFGDPSYWRFTMSGDYHFHFSRLTDQAKNDYYLHLAQCALSAISITVDVSRLSNLGKLIANALVQFTDGGITDLHISADEIIGIVYGVLVDYLGTDLNQNFLNWRLAGRLLQRSFMIYNVSKSALNAMARVAWWMGAPTEIDFCLCYGNGIINTCSEAELYIIGGDNQEGYQKQRLLEPLQVMVKTKAVNGDYVKAYQKVKFEVEDGNGSVSESVVITDEEGLASTYWNLGVGEIGDVQSVTAYCIDLVTGEAISDPVVFYATIKGEPDVTIRLDWIKLSGRTDIDLHVIDPFGEEIFFSHMNSASGGWLDRDDIVGPGPEHIYWDSAPEGTYTVMLHYYPGSESRAVTSYRVTINVGGSEIGNYTGSIGYDQLITIGSFTIPLANTRSVSGHANFVEKFEIQENVLYPSKMSD